MDSIIILTLKVILIAAFLYAAISYKTRALLLFPVYLVLFDVIYGFYQAGSGFGTIRNLTLLLFIIYLILINKSILSHNKWITAFLLYTMLLIPLSSNLQNSAIDYICVFVSLMCFPVGFYFMRNVDDLKTLNISMTCLAVIFVLNSIICSALGLGIDYYGGGFTLGGFVASKLFAPALFIALLPIMMPLLRKRSRIVTIVLAVLVFVFLLLSMRRTSVFIPVFAYMLYFLLSKRKFQFIAISVIFITMLLALFPFYEKVLKQQFMARSETFDNPSLEQEYRYKESIIIYKETFSNLKTMLIGRDIFNSAGNYNQGKWKDRPVHIDYNLILHGSGLIGVLLYLAIFYDILVKFFRYSKAIPKDEYFDELVMMFKILFILVLVVSLNGGMVQLSYRAVIFLYLGGLLGIFHKYYTYQNTFNDDYPSDSSNP